MKCELTDLDVSRCECKVCTVCKDYFAFFGHRTSVYLCACSHVYRAACDHAARDRVPCTKRCGVSNEKYVTRLCTVLKVDLEVVRRLHRSLNKENESAVAVEHHL